MIRSFLIVAVLGIVALVLVPVQWLAVQRGWSLRRDLPVVFHRLVLGLATIRVEVHGAPADDRPLLLVSNHASWLDIPVLSSILPVVFIAKSEIARWPLFGLFAKLQRSVFVDRARRQATGEVNRTIAARLSNGDPVVLFGEGTAGDGNCVLPFRSALLGALREALGDSGRGFVQPVSLAYTRLHGLPMGRQHRPRAACYGEMPLLPHLKSVLREGAIDVVVSFGLPLEVEPGVDRKALARSVEDAVRRMTAAALGGRGIAAAGTVSIAAETRYEGQEQRISG